MLFGLGAHRGGTRAYTPYHSAAPRDFCSLTDSASYLQKLGVVLQGLAGTQLLHPPHYDPLDFLMKAFPSENEVEEEADKCCRRRRKTGKERRRRWRKRSKKLGWHSARGGFVPTALVRMRHYLIRRPSKYGAREISSPHFPLPAAHCHFPATTLAYWYPHTRTYFMVSTDQGMEDPELLRNAIDDELKSLEESARALKHRRNALAPISCLPSETIAIIFSFLSLPEKYVRILTGYGQDTLAWLRVSHHHSHSVDLQGTLDQLVSSASSLEWLSLIVEDELHMSLGLPVPAKIPYTLFDGIAPRLSRLQLDHCDISWKSPLLKSLRILELHTLSPFERPSLEDWLDAMGQMLQLETLVVHFATPMASSDSATIAEPQRIITHPSLIQLNISASAADCALALTHLVLPALTRVRVDVHSDQPGGDDVLTVVPYFGRNAHGPQDEEPLQSILVSGEQTLTEIVVWTVPDADVDVKNPVTLISATTSARAVFTASCRTWRFGTDAKIVDAALTALPINSLTTLTAQNSTHFPAQLWLDHAPRWPLLERVRLVDYEAKGSFTDALAENTSSEVPLLPSLTKLTLMNTIFSDEKYKFRDMLMGRIEQGVPLECLDLHLCEVTDRTVQFLEEVVVDVQGPSEGFRPTVRWPTLSNWTRDMGLLLFHRDDDDEDEDESDDDFSDDVIINPWFHGYLDDEEDEEEGEGEGIEEGLE
ncbi:hypothetical protein B0F90DRAFT_1669361 [Multifurca ochricompacta]|uniref:F-box domain-containing protein n=1 Tax=Multifurca ochricompacta TaxID=376703 RepID=A0AAD4QLX4_9AGAM|nr:hypothetical protein B0F90DRAFT_1669361 [Multifurca ochricompacta]